MPDRATGPGTIAPDGSPVGFYLALDPEGEPGIIHDALGDGATILELGSGAGRVTHPLMDLGHPVVAVDESPEMLAQIRGAETVCARIEELDLDRRFDGVVLGSHLINLPDPEVRRAMLRTCRAHLRPHGRVLVERMHDAFFADGSPNGGREHNGVRIEARDFRRPDRDTLVGTMHYTVADRHWTQPVHSVRFDTGELAEAGLRPDRTLTDDGRWLAAAPA